MLSGSQGPRPKNYCAPVLHSRWKLLNVQEELYRSNNEQVLGDSRHSWGCSAPGTAVKPPNCPPSSTARVSSRPATQSSHPPVHEGPLAAVHLRLDDGAAQLVADRVRRGGALRRRVPVGIKISVSRVTPVTWGPTTFPRWRAESCSNIGTCPFAGHRTTPLHLLGGNRDDEVAVPVLVPHGAVLGPHHERQRAQVVVCGREGSARQRIGLMPST